MRGADQCRSYACKYCGKPEPWYFLETATPGGEANPVKRYLQARNVGLCMCHNRLIGHHVVRSTRPTLFLWPQFTVQECSRIRRAPDHVANVWGYPDQSFYMNQVQTYFFRNEALQFLRAEQFFRYFAHRSEDSNTAPLTQRTHDETADADEGSRCIDDPTHRHYDASVSVLLAGEQFPSAAVAGQCAGAHKRQTANLCVPRSSFLEPCGGNREAFYEQRLLFGIPWHCVRKPRLFWSSDADKLATRWFFATAAPNTPPELSSFTMTDRVLDDEKTFESLCIQFERTYASEGYACECCQGHSCQSCTHARGWHVCERDCEERWRAGTLHEGVLDIHSTLWALARRLVPLHVLKEKLDVYIQEGHLPEDAKESFVEVFEQMHSICREQNVYADPGASSAANTDAENAPMSKEELQAELASREQLLRRLHGSEGAWTDQWRVYEEIVSAISENRAPLRMFLQASAGTGKSFLLETVYLWATLQGHRVQACAPTGIAAARLRVPRTPVRAYTMHHLFGLSIELESKVDPNKLHDETAQRLLQMTVLIIDEVSMIEDGAWFAMKDQLSTMAAVPLAEPGALQHPTTDSFGRAHLVLACDFKQLPPATNRPPFIAADSTVLEKFSFRVLRENRRLTPSEDPLRQQGLEQFHNVLEAIAHGCASPPVQQFFVDAYVRGAMTTQQNVAFDDSTSCFTLCRFRNRWNRQVLKRSAKRHHRSQTFKAVFATQGTDKQWIRDSAAGEIKRSVRSQSLVTLRLAGQWFEDAPISPATRPHWMRVMLVANTDVAGGFANGALGRAVHWGPEGAAHGLKSKSFLANVPGVQLRFFHEASIHNKKAHFLPQVDFCDLEPRKEKVAQARGKPSMLQLQVQPAYGLTIHKVQSMTIRHNVNGCLEGVFAHGQIYVLTSRVTQPEHFFAIGVPPLDMLEVIAAAWYEAGIDVDKAFRAAASVTEEWAYRLVGAGEDPCRRVAARFSPRYEEKRRVPLRMKTLAKILNPQEETASVLHGLLGWIDRADRAHQNRTPRPDICRADGSPLFPDTEWYLTDMKRNENKYSESCGMEYDAPFYDDDLTMNPEEAGGSSSDSASSGALSSDNSAASFPAGPSCKRRSRHVPQTTTNPASKKRSPLHQHSAVAATSSQPPCIVTHRLQAKTTPDVDFVAPEL